MKRSSTLYTTLVAAAAGAAAAYLFGTESGARVRTVASDRADDSARWLRDRTSDVHDRLVRIEGQIDHLGEEMRRRLDELQAQAAGALTMPTDPGTDWPRDEDVQRDLQTRS